MAGLEGVRRPGGCRRWSIADRNTAAQHLCDTYLERRARQARRVIADLEALLDRLKGGPS
jgi:hypothetical protein